MRTRKTEVERDSDSLGHGQFSISAMFGILVLIAGILGLVRWIGETEALAFIIPLLPLGILSFRIGRSILIPVLVGGVVVSGLTFVLYSGPRFDSRFPCVLLAYGALGCLVAGAAFTIYQKQVSLGIKALIASFFIFVVFNNVLIPVPEYPFTPVSPLLMDTDGSAPVPDAPRVPTDDEPREP